MKSFVFSGDMWSTYLEFCEFVVDAETEEEARGLLMKHPRDFLEDVIDMEFMENDGGVDEIQLIEVIDDAK